MDLKEKIEDRKYKKQLERLNKLKKIRAREEKRAGLSKEILEENKRYIMAKEINQKAEPIHQGITLNRMSKFGKSCLRGAGELMKGIQDIGQEIGDPSERMVRPSKKRKYKKKKSHKFKNKRKSKRKTPIFYNPFDHSKEI